MDIKENENLQVSGFRFQSREDLEKALTEQQKVEYFKRKTEGKQVKVLHALYDQLLDEKIFQTPVGIEYLKELQQKMLEEGISEEQIRPIPLYNSYSHKTGEELDRMVTRQRIVAPKKKKKVNIDSLQISVGINVLLVILVLAMFVITLQSDHPNILNYKSAVLNEYSTWEQELSEREKAVREKERTLELTEMEAEGKKFETKR